MKDKHLKEDTVQETIEVDNTTVSTKNTNSLEQPKADSLNNTTNEKNEVAPLETNTNEATTTAVEAIDEQGETTTEQQDKEQEETEEEKAKRAYDELWAQAKWYVLHTFSSYENVAKENLEIVIEKYHLEKRIFDIIIPMEDVMEEKNGKRKIVSRKLMPGYIIVKMIYGDDIWHAITRTRGITGFVGPKGRPLPLTSEEIRKMKLEKTVILEVDFAVGDKVEVLEGALFGFIGEVVTLDIEANKCRVIVEMFGRETPVDLTLEQIRKV